MKNVTILGTNSQTGAYLLRIRVKETVEVQFGRFNRGNPIQFVAGEYVYVGSAMGQRGSSSLARRLLRHATRSDHNNPHAVRAEMLAAFTAVSLGPSHLAPPASKKRFWHIDYLLEVTAVSLQQILVIRTPNRIEHPLANWLVQQPETNVVAAGLGARDHKGSTHLLNINANATWWANLPTQFENF